jgi:5-methylthioribose kinase
MTSPDTPAGYAPLDAGRLIALLMGHEGTRMRLGESPERWTVREVGDGNLNLVFIVGGPSGSVCVKQALPYVRVAGPSWPLSLDRIYYEQAYYAAVGPHVRGLGPEILFYDPVLYCLVMENLTPHIILRNGLIGGLRYPGLGHAVGDFIARATFHTSDLAEPLERKMSRLALFAGNQSLLRITVDLVFTDPYRQSERNRQTTPQLDDIAAALRADAALKAAVGRWGEIFLTRAQALLHGDLHSGSIMVTQGDTRIIDPEFAFYGPIGFDLGAFLGNLLLAWCAQPGHATAEDERAAYRDWILGETVSFWETFQTSFLALWQRHGTGDAYPAALYASPDAAAALDRERAAYLRVVHADMIGFAACKMIRRILGFAHVADFERIVDRDTRGRCERRALELALEMLVSPERFESPAALGAQVSAGTAGSSQS